MTGSLRAYAKHRKEKGLIGGSLAAVQKALASNRILKGSDGKIDFDRADHDWEQNLNRHKATTRRTKDVVTAGAPEESSAPAGTPMDGNFLEAQRQHEWLKVQKEELALRERRGELLEKTEVEQEWGLLLTTFRNRLLLLPDKVAPRVCVMDDVLSCRVLLEREVREALSALSEYQPDAA
jgi:hypothetical protein